MHVNLAVSQPVPEPLHKPQVHLRTLPGITGFLQLAGIQIHKFPEQSFSETPYRIRVLEIKVEHEQLLRAKGNNLKLPREEPG